MPVKQGIILLACCLFLLPSRCPADDDHKDWKGGHKGWKGDHKTGKKDHKGSKGHGKDDSDHVINIFQDDDDLDINVNQDETQKIMNIDTASRTQDWEEMFHQMRGEFPAANIYAVIDGQSLEKIIDVEALSNHTLLKITYLTYTGPKVRTVKVEDMDDLGVRSYRKKGVRVYMPNTNPPSDGL